VDARLRGRLGEGGDGDGQGGQDCEALGETIHPRDSSSEREWKSGNGAEVSSGKPGSWAEEHDPFHVAARMLK
jgi:hypothetical protein